MKPVPARSRKNRGTDFSLYVASFIRVELSISWNDVARQAHSGRTGCPLSGYVLGSLLELERRGPPCSGCVPPTLEAVYHKIPDDDTAADPFCCRDILRYGFWRSCGQEIATPLRVLRRHVLLKQLPQHHADVLVSTGLGYS